MHYEGLDKNMSYFWDLILITKTDVIPIPLTITCLFALLHIQFEVNFHLILGPLYFGILSKGISLLGIQS